jgi:hypothetical protein
MTATLLFTLLPTRTTDRAELLDPSSTEFAAPAHSRSLAHSRNLAGAPALVRTWGLTGSDAAVPAGLFSVRP